tara:strand:- start:5101 stop:5718 length:618 start_codon:yes stop_codon:yes gene_type:complete
VINIVKERTQTEKVISFLSTFKTEKTIYVPMLQDGVIESSLSVNNKLLCKPADENFKVLWEILKEQPKSLSRFIEIYQDPSETSASLSKVLEIQQTKLPKAYTLLSLCRRSEESTLMGGKLLDKQKVFTQKYISELQKYSVPFDLTKVAPKDCLTFQDLTYLTIDEVQSLKDTENLLFITNNKEHIYYFDGADCSLIDNYYLIWR